MLTLLLLGIMLGRNGDDFGLFKLYMYVQPFLAATVAVFHQRLEESPGVGRQSPLLGGVRE